MPIADSRPSLDARSSSPHLPDELPPRDGYCVSRIRFGMVPRARVSAGSGHLMLTLEAAALEIGEPADGTAPGRRRRGCGAAVLAVAGLPAPSGRTERSASAGAGLARAPRS